MGPLPGIVLGLTAILASGGQGVMGEVGRMAVFVNAFNLLPFEPLDGGRVLMILIFRRSVALETAWSVVGGLLLGWLALKIEAWVLLGVVALILVATPRRLSLASAARRLSARAAELAAPAEAMDPGALEALVEESRKVSPQAALPARVPIVREILDRVRFAAPGMPATLGLLVVYGGGVVASAIAILAALRLGPRMLTP
jgi:hypothetical protein